MVVRDGAIDGFGDSGNQFTEFGSTSANPGR
jgi:hypothetical protein